MSVRYSIRFGHQATGRDTAAEGLIKEFDVIRAYAPYVIKGLQSLGYEVLDVTPPENNRTLGDSLNYGINKSNDWGADYFISCHANCDVPTAHGCEAIYGSNAGKVVAERIVKELNNLGFETHLGAYQDVRGLSEIHKTDAIACICEPFFISNLDNINLYLKIGPEKLGYAIVKGLTGKEVIPTQPTIKPTEKPIEQPKANKLTDAIMALQYDLNIDYNAKLKLTGIADEDTMAALRGVQDIICKGHKSNVILWMQQKLIGWGYLGSAQATGVYDENTFQAVTELQKNWQRPTDGILRPDTWQIFLNN